MQQIDESPKYAPDWCWTTAFKLAGGTATEEEQNSFHNGSAPWLSRAFDHIQQLVGPGKIADLVMSAAENIAFGDPLAKSELESRLLAQQSFSEIATHMDIDADVVEAYARVFYAVGDPRGLPQTIRQEVEAVRLHFGLPDKAVDAIWRWCGSIGSQLIDDVLNAVPREQVRRYGLPAYFVRMSPAPLAIRLAVGLKCLRVRVLSDVQKVQLCQLAACAINGPPRASHAWMCEVLALSGILPGAVTAMQTAQLADLQPAGKKRKSAKGRSGARTKSRATFSIRGIFSEALAEMTFQAQQENETILAELTNHSART